MPYIDIYTKEQVDAKTLGVWEELDLDNLPDDFRDGDVLMMKPIATENGTTTGTAIVIADMYADATNWAAGPYKITTGNPSKIYMLDGLYGADSWNNGESTDKLVKLVGFNVNSSTRVLNQDFTRADIKNAIGRIWRLRR